MSTSLVLDTLWFWTQPVVAVGCQYSGLKGYLSHPELGQGDL